MPNRSIKLATVEIGGIGGIGVRFQLVPKMSTPSMLQEIVPFAIFFVVYGVPVAWVLLSSRAQGGAKFGWFIVTLAFSWIGLAVFLIATQAKKNRS